MQNTTGTPETLAPGTRRDVRDAAGAYRGFVSRTLGGFYRGYRLHHGIGPFFSEQNATAWVLGEREGAESADVHGCPPCGDCGAPNHTTAGGVSEDVDGQHRCRGCSQIAFHVRNRPRGSAYFPDGEEDRIDAEEERRLPTVEPDPDDEDLLAFVEVAPGEFDAYRHNYLIASITTRQDGIRVLWDDSRGSDDGPALRADPRRFATIDAAQMAVRQETR